MSCILLKHVIGFSFLYQKIYRGSFLVFVRLDKYFEYVLACRSSDLFGACVPFMFRFAALLKWFGKEQHILFLELVCSFSLYLAHFMHDTLVICIEY